MAQKRKYLDLFRSIKEELGTLSQAIKTFNGLHDKSSKDGVKFSTLLKKELGIEFKDGALNMTQFIAAWTNRVDEDKFAVYSRFAATYTIVDSKIKGGKEVAYNKVFNVYYFDEKKERKQLFLYGLKQVQGWTAAKIANGLEQHINSEYYTDKEMKSLDFVSKLKANNNLFVVRLDKDKDGNPIEVNEALFTDGKPSYIDGVLNF